MLTGRIFDNFFFKGICHTMSHLRSRSIGKGYDKKFIDIDWIFFCNDFFNHPIDKNRSFPRTSSCRDEGILSRCPNRLPLVVCPCNVLGFSWYRSHPLSTPFESFQSPFHYFLLVI